MAGVSTGRLRRVIEDLPAAAGEAWRAYNAMESSKKRHFDLLRGLEEKYAKYGRANAEERARLARLLADHDEQVGRFRSAVCELKERDPKAHSALVNYLAALNRLAAHAKPEAGPEGP